MPAVGAKEMFWESLEGGRCYQQLIAGRLNTASWKNETRGHLGDVGFTHPVPTFWEDQAFWAAFQGRVLKLCVSRAQYQGYRSWDEDRMKRLCLEIMPWTNPGALHIHNICVFLFVLRKGGNFAASPLHFVTIPGRERASQMPPGKLKTQICLKDWNLDWNYFSSD